MLNKESTVIASMDGISVTKEMLQQIPDQELACVRDQFYEQARTLGLRDLAVALGVVAMGGSGSYDLLHERAPWGVFQLVVAGVFVWMQVKSHLSDLKKAKEYDFMLACKQSTTARPLFPKYTDSQAKKLGIVLQAT